MPSSAPSPPRPQYMKGPQLESYLTSLRTFNPERPPRSRTPSSTIYTPINFDSINSHIPTLPRTIRGDKSYRFSQPPPSTTTTSTSTANAQAERPRAETGHRHSISGTGFSFLRRSEDEKERPAKGRVRSASAGTTTTTGSRGSFVGNVALRARRRLSFLLDKGDRSEKEKEKEVKRESIDEEGTAVESSVRQEDKKSKVARGKQRARDSLELVRSSIEEESDEDADHVDQEEKENHHPTSKNAMSRNFHGSRPQPQPPFHPPSKNESQRIEAELEQHFSQRRVLPLRISKNQNSTNTAPVNGGTYNPPPLPAPPNARPLPSRTQPTYPQPYRPPANHSVYQKTSYTSSGAPDRNRSNGGDYADPFDPANITEKRPSRADTGVPTISAEKRNRDVKIVKAAKGRRPTREEIEGDRRIPEESGEEYDLEDRGWSRGPLPPKPPVHGSSSRELPPKPPSHGGGSARASQGSSISVPVINFPDESEEEIDMPRGNLKPAPPIPRINLPSDDEDDTPKKPIPGVPTISLPDDDDEPPTTTSGRKTPPAISASRALPTPGSRPLPDPKQKPTATARPRNLPANACTSCYTPITTRAVSALNHRYHPTCFRCHHCHTRLEHVGFYPEPIAERQKRAASASPPLHEDEADIRFYCHLDFHELFSPRCGSCTTPIEGEVVVACGKTWHKGHFFCAECGDPFDESKSRFVEKDGYAWCLGCFDRRFAEKCARCKKGIEDVVVSAVGKRWCRGCFVCSECNSEFEDGRFFLRGDDTPVCTKCEERRLKA